MRPLAQVFAGSAAKFPDLLIGLENPDDAAVYRITDDVAVILTTDFFTPVVDNPYEYGAIAAANAMSDVYAMGGEVVLALNIAGLPADLPLDIAREILRGGAEKVREAGAVIAGGHTVDDPEPKYGLAVMGLIHPSKVAAKGGARPGDVLMLTKPMGVGIVTTALKSDVAETRSIEEAVASMIRLNRDAARAMTAGVYHAATDVTGFGLLGHAWEMAGRTGVRFRFHFRRAAFRVWRQGPGRSMVVPWRSQQERGRLPRARRGWWTLSDEMQLLLFTPETSGGLLIAVPAEEEALLRTRCVELGQPIWRVGEVLSGDGILVV